MTTLAEFKALVNGHDITYSYSDDSQVCRNGQVQYDRIREAAKSLPIDDVKRIWNAKVDSVLSEGYRELFYWRG